MLFDSILTGLVDNTFITGKKTKYRTDKNSWQDVYTKRGLFGDGGGDSGGGSAPGTPGVSDSGAVNGVSGEVGLDSGPVGSCSNTVGCSVDDGGGYSDSTASGKGGLPEYFYVTSQSGIYAGSLSAQGNMLAMQINPGAMNVSGNIATPFLTGYVREYWRDPTKCTFGSQSAMPAITGVMPAEFVDTPGNFNYYIDLQITRILGSNGFDQFSFYNKFNQMQAWVQTSNSYLAGLINAENNNLAYYGFQNYDDLVTQGFNKYKTSRAIPAAFDNAGYLVETIPLGYFGTANAVAKTMVDRGLGAVGNLSGKLFDAGIVYQQIGNPNYTDIISNLLLSITDPGDLVAIQQVLKTNVVDMNSPMDYTSIVKLSGLTNDSEFANMAEVGLDIYLRAPGSNFVLGTEVAQLVRNLIQETNAVVETIRTSDSLLTPEIVASLRSYLPLGDGNRPITIIDVIGTASGYLTPYLNEVNVGFKELYATEFGPQLRTIMEDMSRYAAGVPINETEVLAAQQFKIVPPPQVTLDANGNTVPIIGTGGPGYWATRFYSAADEFFALLNRIVVDPTTAAIAKRINDNYYTACKLLSREVLNYGKANITSSSFNDNTAVFAFVNSLPELAADKQNIGTDYFLYGVGQNNYAGNIFRTIIAQGKNNYFLSDAGAKITGVV